MHHLFVRGKNISNLIPQECTGYEIVCSIAGRTLTFIRQEKLAKGSALLPVFYEVRHVPPLKPFLVSSRCDTQLSSSTKGECSVY